MSGSIGDRLYADLLLEGTVGAGSAEAVRSALGARYPGLRFNGISIERAFDMVRQATDHPERDFVAVSFNLSGSATDLVRYRFADPEWLTDIPPCGVRTVGASTSCFGSVYMVRRTKSGFRLTYARYDDGLDRLASIFVPEILARVIRAPPSGPLTARSSLG